MTHCKTHNHTLTHTVIAYNAEKEAKAAWQQKQKELNEIEEAKKKEAMKGVFCGVEGI